MCNRFSMILAIVVAALLLAACSPGSQEKTLSKKPIIVWTTFPGQLEEEVEELFDEYVHDFLVIHPEVTIIHSAVPWDELLEKFKTDAQLGLGPDLLIGPSFWVPELAEQGLIQDLSNRDNVDTSIYHSAALETLRYRPEDGREQGLYGLPITLGSTVLYYNKNLVGDLPPTTLPALLEQAAEGKKVALDTSFSGAFWGIQAFGGQLFDQDGRVVLDQGGFANWLGWLKAAQHNPNIILNNNQYMLLDLFLEGKVAYWVGDSSWLVLLMQTFGEDVVGVAPLPAGPNNNPAGPFLYTAALMFNAASSPAQTERALRLAQFLTNVEQQTTMVLQSKFAPANRQVRIDPRVAPGVAAVATQTKTAVPWLHLPQLFDPENGVLAYGDDIYVKALAGDIGLNEAATELTNLVNTRYGFEAHEVASEVDCDQLEGTIEVWHRWDDESGKTTLDQIARNFMALCPTVSIDLSASEREELHDRYRNAVAQGQGPDLLITDQQFVASLVTAGLVSDLTHLVEPEFLQRYVPGAQETMSYKGKLYGLPVTMESMAMYYNKELVTDPARDLTDLLNQASPERQVVLPVDFYFAYWGIPAFGGRLFDTEGRVILNEGGFAEWLSWLQVAQDQPGIEWATSREAALELFIKNEAAYLAGEKWMENELQEKLGTDKLSVAPLPAGPKGEAGPFLVVAGALLNSASGPMEGALALEFARYIAGLESQTLLMKQANYVPANVNVATTGHPIIGGFLEQARTAAVVPNDRVEQVVFMWYLDYDIYEEVLVGGQNPSKAVNTFTRLVNEAHNGAEPQN